MECQHTNWTAYRQLNQPVERYDIHCADCGRWIITTNSLPKVA
mgnify:CR=1